MKMSLMPIVAVGLSLSLFLGGCSMDSETSTQSTSQKKEKVDTSVKYADIYKEFKKNKLRAQDKYNDKRYKITAKVNSMETSGLLNLSGGATLTMQKTIDNTVVFFYAEFEQDQEDKLKKINTGDKVTFIGTCSDGNFIDCKLQ